MKLPMITSIFFFMSLHPLTMLMTLIFMTLNIIYIVYMTTKTSWLPMILILLILGGMLVLFIYITSITPNKKFYYKKWGLIFLIFPLLINTKMTFLNFSKLNILLFNIDKNSYLLIFITVYLLLTLIAVMQLINSSIAPVRMYL
uniref:NADH dehydrogenase subunit 6 n=1 Tax=Argas vulgaris TaxID=59638 RepID=UPI002E773F03|nr:NADH dehydrogenase subunit 6 [Argas vulgaris]WQM44088.1 NADH dehydrogenase subunit 6 [Argas vulgaris]